jgi:hypothetical protein
MISTVERLFETMCLIRAFEDEAGKMLELGFAFCFLLNFFQKRHVGKHDFLEFSEIKKMDDDGNGQGEKRP